MAKRKRNDLVLTEEEKSYESEHGWNTVNPNSARHKEVTAKLSKAVDSIKEARFTARISNQDLELLKARATAEGLGYQTLIGSLVHKYVTGRLVDLDAAQIALEVLMRKKKQG